MTMDNPKKMDCPAAQEDPAGVDRRSALKWAAGLGASAMIAPNLLLIAAPAPSAASEDHRWAMLIDLNQCSKDCTACTEACRKENNVPTFPDDPARDIHWIRKVQVHDPKGLKPDRSVPVLCNHCEDPPCVHVCPTEASFIRKDGLVLVDKHRCIGCRYCMIACPYKARSLVYHHTTFPKGGNPEVPIRGKGVVEKCTFCVHRVDRGLVPSCVQACAKEGNGGMVFGDLNDPDSAIVRRIKAAGAQGLREDLGLKPHVHYQGL